MVDSGDDMNANRFRLNSSSKASSDGDLKMRVCNENRSNFRPVDHRFAGRRTPSPPKTLLPPNQYLKPLNGLDVRPVFKNQSQTKSCYTGCQSSNGQNKLPTASVVTDCTSRLQRLQKSGLLARFANFQATKSVPLALEEEEEDENDDNVENEIFDDDVQIIEPDANNTIELKSSGEFEPKFVTEIRQEVRKLSFQSSQRTQKTKSNESLGVSKGREEVRKSSYSTQSSQRTRKSKSNDNIVESKRDSKKEVVNCRLDAGGGDRTVKPRRSRSSNARLDPNSSDKQNESKSNRSRNDSIGRKSGAEQNSIHRNDSQSSVNPSHNSISDKAIRKIKVNNKYYQILNCIGQGGSSKVRVCPSLTIAVIILNHKVIRKLSFAYDRYILEIIGLSLVNNGKLVCRTV